MELSALEITMISSTVLQADDVDLVVSLSGYESNLVVSLSSDKSRLVISLFSNESSKRDIPVLRASPNPWLGLTFRFPVDEAMVAPCCLKFKIKKAQPNLCNNEDLVGEVDVPVGDLLVNVGAGDQKKKVRSYDVKSSSGETKGNLAFFCKLVSPAREPVMHYAAEREMSASNSAAIYPPPMPGAALWWPSWVRYPPPAISHQATWGHMPNAAPNYGHPAPPLYPVAVPSPPMPGGAPYSQMAYPPYHAPAHVHPPPHMHPQALYGPAAPQPPPRDNFWKRLLSGVAVIELSNVLDGLLFGDNGL